MSIKNSVMLITYADSLGENLRELDHVMNKHFKKAIGGIHLLPFFPSTGDRGFAPTDYSVVDKQFGNWGDIETLSQTYYLMFDFMINHVSKESRYFKDYKKNNQKSKYKDMFIDVDEFYPKGRPTQEDIIYKRKSKPPFQTVHFEDGKQKRIWNTFGEQQLDLNVKTDITKDFIKSTIRDMSKRGCSLIRLDAFAYAIKKLNTNCFFVEPDIWNLLDEVRLQAEEYDIEILPEIHEHYSIQMKIAEHDYYIYDFALPMITLYSLYSGTSHRLKEWLEKSPMKQFTTLDTHDGIGVVDARDLLSNSEINYTTEQLYKVGANVKRVYSSEMYNNLDIYQINSTYYSALGNDDRSYLLSRAIQCFAPGIPQVYYVGLLAGKNDINLLESTKEGRNINRHYYDIDEINIEVQRPVVQHLLKLLEYRNESSSFDLMGKIIIETPDESTIIIERVSEDEVYRSIIEANLATKEFVITDNTGFVLKQLNPI